MRKRSGHQSSLAAAAAADAAAALTEGLGAASQPVAWPDSSSLKSLQKLREKGRKRGNKGNRFARNCVIKSSPGLGCARTMAPTYPDQKSDLNNILADYKAQAM